MVSNTAMGDSSQVMTGGAAAAASPPRPPAVRPLTPSPARETLRPFCAEITGCPSKEDVLPCTKTMGMLFFLFTRMTEDLPPDEVRSMSREIHLEMGYLMVQKEDPCHPVQTERRINELLHSEREQHLELPMIKSRDYSCDPPTPVYYEERGQPELIGTDCMARIVELYPRKPLFAVEIVLRLYNVESHWSTMAWERQKMTAAAATQPQSSMSASS